MLLDFRTRIRLSDSSSRCWESMLGNMLTSGSFLCLLDQREDTNAVQFAIPESQGRVLQGYLGCDQLEGSRETISIAI